MSIKREVDSIVEMMALKNSIVSFHPESISNFLNTPLSLVIERLNFLVNDEILKLKYEVRCENDSSIITIIDDYSELLGKEIYCIRCNEYNEITMDNIYPIYYINEEYRKYIKKKSLEEKVMRKSEKKHIITQVS